MPKVPSKKHETNGHMPKAAKPVNRVAGATAGIPVPGEKTLAKHLESKRKSGTDNIVIAADESPEVELECSTLVDAEKLIEGVKYLLHGWIPFGMITGIVAEPGVGKSALALWLARSILTGESWFNGMKGPKPGRVIWCGTENDLAITVHRAKQWKLPFDKLIFPFSDPTQPVNLTYDGHLEHIEALVRRHQAQAVFVDSLRSGHDGDENNSQVGRVVQNLAGIAERTRAAIPVVHHSKKLGVDEDITANSSRGSNAIMAMMRSVIGIDRPDINTQWCRMRVLKENLGIAPAPVGLLVTNAGLQFGSVPQRPRRETQKDDAEEWLRKRLKPGKSYKAAEIIEEAAQYGHSERTIRKAATERIGIRPESVRKDGKISGWTWKLP